MAFCGRCGNPVGEGVLCSNCGTPSTHGTTAPGPTGSASPGGAGGREAPVGFAPTGYVSAGAQSGGASNTSNLLTYISLGIACIALVVSLFAIMSPGNGNGDDFGPAPTSKFSIVGSAVDGA